MKQGLLKHWRHRFVRMMFRRHGKGDHTRLTHSNLYIWLTIPGALFLITLLVMLLTSINYQLSLGMLFTFLLGSCGLIAMPFTQANLRGIEVELHPQQEVFAHRPVELHIQLFCPDSSRWAIKISFYQSKPATEVWTHIPENQKVLVTLPFTFNSRGQHPWPAIDIETLFPLGIWLSWSHWKSERLLVVFPAPETNAPALPLEGSNDALQPHEAIQLKTDNEFDSVRPYQQGDSTRLVIWKRLAQADQLISREASPLLSQTVWLRFGHTGLIEAESQLSRLCAWVLMAEAMQYRYGLKLPTLTIEPDCGTEHRLRCLTALALYQ